MGPQPPHAGEVVLELGELDLELALGRVGVVGEDVEDHRGAVDHRHPQCRLEVALLARRELVVAGDQVGVDALGLGLDVVELAAPEVAVRVGRLAHLGHLARGRDPGRAQQLLQLGERVAASPGAPSTTPIASARWRARRLTTPASPAPRASRSVWPWRDCCTGPSVEPRPGGSGSAVRAGWRRPRAWSGRCRRRTEALPPRRRCRRTRTRGRCRSRSGRRSRWPSSPAPRRRSRRARRGRPRGRSCGWGRIGGDRSRRSR